MILPARDWDEAGIGDDDIAIRQQDQIAVYWNERGEVVIRQHSWPDDDTIILVAPENASRLADAILRCAAELSGEVDQADNNEASPEPPRRPPMTPAERKRRQRELEKSSHECHDANVTARNAKRDTNGTVVELPFLPAADKARLAPHLLGEYFRVKEAWTRACLQLGIPKSASE